ERVVRGMGLVKLKLVAAVILSIGLLGGVMYYTPAAEPPKKTEPKAVQTARDPRLPPVEDDDAGKDEDAPAVKTLPPVVGKTLPRAGDTAVDAEKVTELRVTFSKDMMDKSWSWTQISDETFPKVTGKPHYDKDGRTCVLPVKLEAGKTYVLWLNSEKFDNF